MSNEVEAAVEAMDPTKEPVDLTAALDALVASGAIPDKEDVAGRCKDALEFILGVQVSGFSILVLKPDGGVMATGAVNEDSPEDLRRLSRAMAVQIGKLLG
jgi:hypothetical protein